MTDLSDIDAYALTATERRVLAHHHVGQLAPFEVQCLLLAIGEDHKAAGIRHAIETVLDGFAAFSGRFHRGPGGELVRTQNAEDRIALRNVLATDITARLRDAAFEVDGGPMAMACLAQDGDNHLFGLALHPAVADMAGLQAMETAFVAALRGQQPAPKPIRAPSEPSGQALRRRLKHWQPILAEGAFTNATLPQRHGAVATGALGRTTQPVQLDARTQNARPSFAEVETRLAAAMGLVLSRYTGRPKLRFLLSARQARADRICDDLLPCTLSVARGESVAQILGQMRAACREALAHQLPSALLLQEMLKAERPDQDPLGAISLNVLRDLSRASGIDRLVQPEPPAHGQCQVLARLSDKGTITLSARYGADLFEPAVIDRFLVHIARVYEASLSDPEQPADRIALLSHNELDLLSAPYEDSAQNDTRAFHQVIADHARLTPDKTALIFEDLHVSHRELNRRANRLAHLLIKSGVSTEAPVAILLERGSEAITAILATAKAGGGFIPVDPGHPQQRNHHILTDAGVRLVVTRACYLDCLPADMDAPILCLEEAPLDGQPETDPDVSIHPDQLAYIMYTSGSTGKPKGVAVEHGPLSLHNQATARVYEMQSDSRELPFLPFSSDGGHERWMVPLMVGGSAVIPHGPLWTPEQSFAAMRRYGCDNASLPTSYLQQLAEWTETTGEAPPMRLYSFGGEALPRGTFDLLSRALKAPLLINGYGPTETIMTPMVWKVRAGTRFSGTYAPLGRAVGDRRAYVLDGRMMPCPIGVVGEIHLGGSGVARGYVNRPGTTADRFIPDPFGPQLDGTCGGRLYRTGDLGRWREDGTIEFLGRVDLQIKLDGHRVEPGEIEAVLQSQPGVSEAHVMLREDDGDARLVAYVVAPDGTDEDRLLQSLEQHLPAHMIPSTVVVLDQMPTNANAKIDRQALPVPVARDRRALGVPPAGETERVMLAMWQAELRNPHLGVTDGFFDMGGASLRALKLLARMRTRWSDKALTIADLFDAPTVRQLAARIDAGQSTGRQAVALRRSGNRPMLYCFPGLLVSTHEYMKLTDHLGPDQPVTGFLCHSLNEAKRMNVSVQEVVGDYAKHIRLESSGRPCAFLGWSWGGLLAWETAQQLQGEIDLRMIGMVDVCDLGTDFAPDAVPSFAPGERDCLMSDLMAWLAQTQMRTQWDALIGAMDPLCFEQFLRFIGNELEPLPTDGPDVSSREHTFWVLIDNALVFRRYQLQPLDVRVDSFTAGDSLSRGLNLVDWRRLSRLATPSRVVPGSNHLHIIGNKLFHSQFSDSLQRAFEI